MNEHEIVNKKNEIVKRLFQINKTRYSITGTGWNLGIKDVVTNLETGKQKSFYRSDLKRFLIKNKAVKI